MIALINQSAVSIKQLKRLTSCSLGTISALNRTSTDQLKVFY